MCSLCAFTPTLCFLPFHHHHHATVVIVPPDIWDTAGQERFNSMHASYYHRAHACIMVFDVTRKVTYKNLERWYNELQQHCAGVPTLVVANKIDVDYQVWVGVTGLGGGGGGRERGSGPRREEQGGCGRGRCQNLPDGQGMFSAHLSW